MLFRSFRTDAECAPVSCGYKPEKFSCSTHLFTYEARGLSGRMSIHGEKITEFRYSNWKTRKARYDVAEASIGRVLTVRMAPGDDLFGTTLKICQEKNVKAGVILSVAASLQKAVLRNVWQFPDPFPINDECRIFTPIGGPLELLQMSGNITQTEAGEPYLHAHVTISMGRPEATCFGGHLVEGCTIFSTCEMVIAELADISFMRLMDKHTRVGEVFGIETNGKSDAAIQTGNGEAQGAPQTQGRAVDCKRINRKKDVQGAAPYGAASLLLE